MTPSIEDTIESLRLCNRAQSEVINRLEHYQQAIAGALHTLPDTPAGYGNGYVAEIGYLTSRKTVLETLIASVERYGSMSAESNGISRAA